MKILSMAYAAVAVIVSLSARAQGTTEEEYNYLTKGYAIQVSSGLDMKKGYTLKDQGAWSTTSGSIERTTTFKALYRDGQTKPCAMLMIYRRLDTNLVAYYCIPSPDADNALWQRMFSQVEAATNELSSGQMDAAIIFALAHMTMQEATK